MEWLIIIILPVHFDAEAQAGLSRTACRLFNLALAAGSTGLCRTRNRKELQAKTWKVRLNARSIELWTDPFPDAILRLPIESLLELR